MTLVDTSIWIGHLRQHDRWLQRLLDTDRVLGHVFVVGELALGRLRERSRALRFFDRLPQARVASPAVVMAFIERHGLAGAGIGYVDAHLLAAAALTPPARLWSGDRRLAAVADRLGLGMQPDG